MIRSFNRTRLFQALIASLVLSALDRNNALAQLNTTNYFIIESEDFNFSKGQTLDAASQMPYLGGAYAGKRNATNSVDFSRVTDGSSPLYRNDARIPILLSPDLNREAWTVTQNFRLGAIHGNEWFNYSRQFAPGKYRVYAAISHGDTGDGLCQGTLSYVTGAATNTTQTVVKKGAFAAPGTGSYDINAVIPLRDTLGRLVILDVNSNQNIRYTAVSGYPDYIKFVRVQPPAIGTQPVDVTVTENQPATFSLTLGSEDPAAFQWQTNQVSVPKATNLVFTVVPPLGADGMVVRCVLTNVIGSTTSAEVTLHVVPDIAKPLATQAVNLGSRSIRLTFNEPVTPPSGPATDHFKVTDGIVVSAVVAGPAPETLDLILGTPLVFDHSYAVSISDVRDNATTPNTILPNTSIGFTAVELFGQDIGRPGIAGSTVRVPGGFDVTGAGNDIANSSDQFQFGWTPMTGDFDIQVRVASATITDAYLHAGLMARESLATNAVFAASFASSAQLGCFFEYRKTAGAVAASAAPLEGAPVNYPQTLLRLRRAGNVLSGYASFDGQSWVPLGSNSFTTLSNTVLVGVAVASESSQTASRVQFRDYGPTANPDTLATRLSDRELLGPSSRRTGLIFSEIMYRPKTVVGSTANLEFIEIYNAGAIFEELTGYQITGGVQFNFPNGLTLQAGQFIVVAADPAAMQGAYGITGVFGPWTGSLNNAGDLVQLKDGHGALKLEVIYSSEAPWPVAADGGGASMVLTSPSYGEPDPRAWSASAQIGGSPGQIDPYLVSALNNVVINEILAHTLLPQVDFVELYNHSNSSADLSGCYLTDDPSTNKFKIPASTSIPARGFISFDENQLGFALSAGGETVYFLDPTGTRILDVVRFGAQESGVSFGRSPDGDAHLRRLASPTPSFSNSPWRVEDVVINEIMYKPISGDSNDEYLELYNRSGASVDLSGWNFTSGLGYTIPSGTLLAPGGYLVVAKNAAQLLSHYPQLSAANTVGDYSGTLGNRGDRISLAKPVIILSTNAQHQVTSTTLNVVVSDLTYGVGGRWGKWSAGGGSSLELIDAHADSLQPSNWADSDESSKTEWTDLTFTGVLDNGSSVYGPDRLQIMLQGAGECLVDEVELFKVGSTNKVLNGNFESTLSAQKWDLMGNHFLSTIDTNGGFGGSRCLHIRSQGDGDTGVNSTRRPIAAGLGSGQTATLRAKARWIAGWPEILFRLHGNWLEYPVRLTVPKNLGTPGQVNSRRIKNAGPAIFEVSHSPAIPRASQPVVVTCRVSDPDGIGSVTLRYRYDPALTLTNVVMRDDGVAPDAIAGDGIYSGVLPGRATGLAAFRVEAIDSAAIASTNVFPTAAPTQECLVRFGDNVPFGTFGHYHLWSTAATESARSASVPLNNYFRDATLVYGHGRIIYNAGFRDKGSPYHNGAGDYAVTVPDDDMLLGVTDRIFGATGNGGSEQSGLRGQVANWFSRELGLPYLHAHYILLYRNGGLHQTVSEDAEQPNNYFAESWFPSGISGDLYKIAIWFEYGDGNTGTENATSATIESFKSGGAYDMARYRWNWQYRATDTANNYTNFFKLVDAVNAVGDYVPGTMALADMEEWMRVYAYHRMMGNWDSWTYNVGQNMYLYHQPGAKWKLMPWDIDFVLGLGDGNNAALLGGIDSVANTRFYNNATFRRMLYRAFLDGIAGPMQPSRYVPQIEARRLILSRNKIPGLTSPADINGYIDGRREYLRTQIAASDVPTLEIANNSGNSFTSSTSVTNITGVAPYKVATIEINGIPYPVQWTGFNAFSIRYPLAKGVNVLHVVGLDLRGVPVAGSSDTLTITYNGVAEQPKDFVVINEIQYNPLSTRSSFIELYNLSTTTPFDLSNYRIDGLGYLFPEGSIIGPTNYLLIVKSRSDFALAYGQNIPVFDQFTGSLNSGGEHLRLVKPGVTPDADLILNDVRYDNKLPWPLAADGFGPSLQLVDASRDTYRVGNWSATDTNNLNRATPGRANAGVQKLASFPLLWINEVLASNVNGPLDNAGDHDSFIELYNSGTNTLNLSDFYLTDSYTNLTQWKFPSGTLLLAKQFLTVWADGETGESTATAPHTSFRLDPSLGSVALVRMQGTPSTPAVMDSIEYSHPPADRSVGSYPDGEPRNRRSFYYSTVGAPNNPVYPDLKVSINEVMAANLTTLADPADGKFSDWFELHNGGTIAVDLTGYRLTDTLTNTTQFVIPAGYVIQPGGFLLVWADGDTQQNAPTNSDLHVNFKLAETGEEIGLFSPDDRMLDGIRFSAQVVDMSLGRFPDGGAGPFVYMPIPTPRKKNNITNANFPPSLDNIADKAIAEGALLAFNVSASDSNLGQSLTYALVNKPPAGAAIDPNTGHFTWQPEETQGPGEYVITVQVTDNGLPALSTATTVRVNVTEVNTLPVVPVIPDQAVVVGHTLRFQVIGSDSDVPIQRLIYSIPNGSPIGAGMNPDSGEFSWTPSFDQVGDHTLTLEITDDGSPPLTQNASFQVTVRAPDQIPSPTLVATLMGDGSIRLSWAGVDGVVYLLQYVDTLSDTVWNSLGVVSSAGGIATVSGIDPGPQPERYFRLWVQQ